MQEVLNNPDLKPIDRKNLSEACKNYMDMLVERDGQRLDRLMEAELKAMDGDKGGENDAEKVKASSKKGTLKAVIGGKEG